MREMAIHSYGPCLNNKQVSIHHSCICCANPTRILGLPPIHAPLPKSMYFPLLWKSEVFFLSPTDCAMVLLVGSQNGNLPTYVTDKLYRAFQAGTIPIYRGAPDIGRYIPDRDAIIRVDDFDSPRALAQYLIQVCVILLNDTNFLCRSARMKRYGTSILHGGISLIIFRNISSELLGFSTFIRRSDYLCAVPITPHPSAVCACLPRLGLIH